MTLVLIIDNYDSFVYNIVQIVGELGGTPVVVRNDEISLRAIERMDPDRIIISPGPGSPERREDVGVSVEVVKKLGRFTPILGICLGHQVIGYAFGARVRKARRVMHGKTSWVKIINRVKLFDGLPELIKATRYNSLVVDDPPSELVVDAVSLDDGEIMAIHHSEYPVYGVQFHPESIGTEFGKHILKNFLDEV